MCEYQNILEIIRLEDDPNSFDLQKDSLCGGDNYMSPFVCHRCKSALSVNVLYIPYFICDQMRVDLRATRSLFLFHFLKI